MNRFRIALAAALAVGALTLTACGSPAVVGEASVQPGGAAGSAGVETSSGQASGGRDADVEPMVVEITDQITVTVTAPAWVTLPGNNIDGGTLAMRPLESSRPFASSIQIAADLSTAILGYDPDWTDTPSSMPPAPADGQEFSYLEIVMMPIGTSTLADMRNATEPVPGTDWRVMTGHGGDSEYRLAYQVVGYQLLAVAAVQYDSPDTSAVDLFQKMLDGKQIRFDITR